uniref:Uncharacterized protein n=1 Tax=Anopheles quadriannulatus TaxID=34691 RepID=A0A182XQ94_ANOQN
MGKVKVSCVVSKQDEYYSLILCYTPSTTKVKQVNCTDLRYLYER